MKKALLLLLLISGFTTGASAQYKFYIDITSISISPINPHPHIGDKVTLTIHLQNDGRFPLINGTNYTPDSFPGGKFYFNYNAGIGSVSENKVDFSHPITLNGMKMNGTETATDTFTLSAAFFTHGENNIVIIWPGAGKEVAGNDSLDTIPKKTATFYISDTTASITPNLTQNSFKIFPNPAKDVVNIQMNEAGTGMIRLMDMTGKLVASKPYSAKTGENISLPLNEGATIPDGLYLVSIETENSSHVSKIMICR